MITGPEFHDFDRGPVIVTASGERCFYCGEPCYDPGWMWDGHTAVIYLHVTCAGRLTLRLNHDAYEYHKKTGTEPRST